MQQEEKLQTYIAYTDGACNNLSPYGEGGSAYIVFDENMNELHKASKGFLNTTNNRMELLAILSVIKFVPTDSFVKIFTDSQYAINAASLRKPTFSGTNSDIINAIASERNSKRLYVSFQWVRGHNGDKWNEVVDKMAQAEREEIRKQNGIPIFSIKNSPKVRKNR